MIVVVPGNVVLSLSLLASSLILRRGKERGLLRICDLRDSQQEHGREWRGESLSCLYLLLWIRKLVENGNCTMRSTKTANFIRECCFIPLPYFLINHKFN